MAIKGPVCGIDNCRSRRYEEGEDAHLYCQNGHQQAGVVHGQDDDDYRTASRTVTRKKREVEEDDRTTSKIPKGTQAFDLYLKCLQLILRHQIWFLVQHKGLPAELETVVYDLWALRIAQLENRIASNENSNADSQPQSQTFSTLESEDDVTDTEKSHIHGVKRKRGKVLSTAPNLNDCLLLCYLGIKTLRLPITPGDIHAWVTDNKLPYWRAIKLVPLPMRDRLLPVYRAVLDPSAPFTYTRFYRLLTDLQISYDADHGIIWPSLNVPLLLFRYLKELALPLELYGTTRRLAELLSYDFAPHYDNKKRMGIRYIAEAQLASCLIVSTKLLCPFSPEQLYWKFAAGKTVAVINWDVWCKEMSEKEAKHPTKSSYQKLSLHQELDVVKSVHSMMATVPNTEDESGQVLRAGQAYPIWETQEDLPEAANVFYEKIGRLAGLPMDMLLLAVRFTEARVEQWRRQQEKNSQQN
ncbi:hypothetical protein COCC4DRAFT_202646 [Bipolaris maydis ATCC 48331]|uniref:Uncharacterized protein n=2 Tax=Cochliobolus heterostrophus TaxID=5016 RepID=M2TW56_COCH5|nr:uncharacterized protein COCC4DRAFT_202646 [Bipolaris maydis ATCC 48331]EMD85946.1 hypothetical protein COCHEDRAFT_1186964 [Bipolaris maydis C5]ENI01949.1 hypothetical protein COCC4DRAFT_202646 [Bipolaris maydis ATCC 48331]KAJ6204017.1 hypothetical protein PSV09DRAFT_1186964 [Bipolaris maydis]